MKKTKIEWCDSTLNPVVGCTFGCSYCYARKMNDRFKFIEDWSKPKFYPERLNELYSKKPKNVFMNSMSDIADWNYSWWKEIIQAILDNPQHNYLFLTKRPNEAFGSIPSSLFIRPYNLWFGITQTGKQNDNVLEHLRAIKKNYGINLFISFEPLLSDPEYWGINLKGIDWIIIGAETGNRKGKIKAKNLWVKRIIVAAKRLDFDIPIFMKDSLIPIIGEENMLREFPEKLKRGEK